MNRRSHSLGILASAACFLSGLFRGHQHLLDTQFSATAGGSSRSGRRGANWGPGTVRYREHHRPDKNGRRIVVIERYCVPREVG